MGSCRKGTWWQLTLDSVDPSTHGRAASTAIANAHKIRNASKRQYALQRTAHHISISMCNPIQEKIYLALLTPRSSAAQHLKGCFKSSASSKVAGFGKRMRSLLLHHSGCTTDENFHRQMAFARIIPEGRMVAVTN